VHVVHLPPRHLARVTAVAALLALLVAVLLALTAGELASSDLPPAPADAGSAAAAAPAPAADPAWVADPLVPATESLRAGR
jgi:hypothetical protein